MKPKITEALILILVLTSGCAGPDSFSGTWYDHQAKIRYQEKKRAEVSPKREKEETGPPEHKIQETSCKDTLAVRDFMADAYAAHTICRLKVQTAIYTGADEPCALQERENFKARYTIARACLENNRSALDAFKDYYIFWRQSMTNLAPELDERKIFYENRLAQQSSGLTARSTKVMVEIETEGRP